MIDRKIAIIIAAAIVGIVSMDWLLAGRPDSVEKMCRDSVDKTEKWVNEMVASGGDVEWDGAEATYQRCLEENKVSP